MGIWLLGLVMQLTAFPAWAAHAYAQFGDIKYAAGFSHFDYVNPQAPKGGAVTLVAPTKLSQFDKYNPFTLKGSPPAGLSGLIFETLLTSTFDEPTTAYGLLASDITLTPDGLGVIIELNPLARFHNGDPVLARDVKHSFDTLTSKAAAPQFRTIFSDVKSATVTGPRTVRFDLRRVNAELPLIVGSLPVFSHKWGAGKAFDQVVTDTPIGSGPYKIGKVNFGRDITYERDPKYWARDLNVRRGMFNFDRVTFKIYKDSTTQLEAFKAGEFDYIQAFIAREWAKSYTGKAFDSGALIKEELPHRNAGDFQGFLFNTRKPMFKDARVRQALGLAMDFEWMNRQLFFNAYTRVRGYFVGSDFEARGLPDANELALLEPLKKQLNPDVLTTAVPQPPSTTPPHNLRGNLRQAQQLLAQAGWTYRDGALRNAQGQPFEFEFLDNSPSMARIVTPYTRTLEKLGIVARAKVVDFAILQKRVDEFDFDVITNRYVGNEAPGTELMERFGSAAASTPGSGNVMGVKDPAVDALIQAVIAARTRPELVSSVRALDRVLRHGYYAVPHWYSSKHRVSYRAKYFNRPTVMPLYYQPEAWVLSTWWAQNPAAK